MQLDDWIFPGDVIRRVLTRNTPYIRACGIPALPRYCALQRCSLTASRGFGYSLEGYALDEPLLHPTKTTRPGLISTPIVHGKSATLTYRFYFHRPCGSSRLGTSSRPNINETTISTKPLFCRKEISPFVNSNHPAGAGRFLLFTKARYKRCASIPLRLQG